MIWHNAICQTARAVSSLSATEPVRKDRIYGQAEIHLHRNPWADARTCVLHPASHTHRQLTDEQLREAE